MKSLLTKKKKMSKKQVVNELHHAARKNFQRRSFEMRSINDTFQIDLVETIPFAKQNKGYKYLLMVIDTFSKYAWIKKLKTKTGKEVTKAMEEILRENPHRCPKNIQSDLGKEFYNSNFQELMKRYRINHYSTYTKLKASIVERFNRTFLNKLWRQFSLQGSHNWLTHFEKIVNTYNRTKHRTIKMRPIDVNERNQNILLRSVYKLNGTINANETSKFQLNDYVRISKFKTIFEKGYTPSWTTEIFKITKILPTHPITYRLHDLNNVNIKGCFYTHELQKTQNKDIYLVEKIIRRKGKKIFVKWLGFDDKENSWIDSDAFVE